MNDKPTVTAIDELPDVDTTELERTLNKCYDKLQKKPLTVVVGGDTIHNIRLAEAFQRASNAMKDLGNVVLQVKTRTSGMNSARQILLENKLQELELKNIEKPFRNRNGKRKRNPNRWR